MDMAKKLARLYSAALEGIDANLIEVEADINVGLHSFNIVGLADRSLTEAKERVNSALKNSGIKPPNRENRKITINLAPADIKKTGSHYDLAIALGYLLATKQIKEFECSNKIFLGELALDGRLRTISGSLSIAQKAVDAGFEYLFLPKQNANEAAVIKGIKIIPLSNLDEVIQILENRRVIEPQKFIEGERTSLSAPDFSEIIGQQNAKRALTIAAAGGHNILLFGPPGVGKSFLARAVGGILPELSDTESIEVTKIWSAAGLNPNRLLRERPFRAPHHSASITAMIGGGPDPKPGEISLAHRGILFLDELPEFSKNAIEALRQPLEAGFIRIARTKQSLLFPARFMLVAAMNPCPCGYFGDPEKACKCSPYEVLKYQKKISGPLLDRIDIQIKIGRMKIEDLRKGKRSPASSPADNAPLLHVVEAARKAQRDRFQTPIPKTNAEMSSRETDELVRLEKDAVEFLTVLDKTRLSPRGYYRLLKVARTIADLDQKENVSADHCAEAFGYRLKEEF